MKVTIFDKDNETVFSEEVKTRSGFVRPYNLSDLPEGDYYVCPLCGYTHEGKMTDRCPVCNTLPEKFEKVA